MKIKSPCNITIIENIKTKISNRSSYLLYKVVIIS